MRIAVCEDEEAQRKLLHNCLMEWAGKNKVTLETVSFENGESFLFAWEDDWNYDLLIFDIEMGEINGMELAARIRKQNEEIPILFVTGYDRYMAQGYDVWAINYLLKPVQKEKLFGVLDRLKVRVPEEKLMFRSEKGSISIKLSNIWYIEARAHRCILYTEDEEYVISSSIGDMERCLRSHGTFVQCHRSYLVNVQHICAVAKSELVLDDKRRLPVSRSISRFQEKLLNRHYDEVETIYRKMRGWRHDYHNHIQTLKAYMSMGQHEKACEYMNGLEEDLTSVDMMLKTGNVMIDAVLNSKLTLIQERNIRVEATIFVPKELPLSDMELSILMGNLLDNAMEACAGLPVEERFIRIYIDVIKRSLYISVINSMSGRAKTKGDRFLSSKSGSHGLGLLRMDNIVSKHGGYLNRQSESGVFATEIMFPLI